MGMKAGKRKKTIEYGRYGYYFVAPFFIVYCLFSLYPLLYTVYLSFMENYSRGLNEVGPNFVGLDNYIGLFKDLGSVLRGLLVLVQAAVHRQRSAAALIDLQLTVGEHRHSHIHQHGRVTVGYG